ncbi:MAG: DUF3383 domain-containing protein [Nitrospirota bacterium]|nr:DUF3383 domain-containing protein [Nitrospirota bacterium]
MVTSQLPISRLISTTINLQPSAAQAQNLSNLLILGSTDIIDTTQRMRTYSTLAEVGSDFGSSAPEYLAASAWFGQSPQPTAVMIGRWAQTATHGRLVGGLLSAYDQLISLWTAVLNGSFSVTIDSVVHPITTLNFSAVTSMNGVAAALQAALPVGVTCIWDANYNRFVFKSSTTGASSSVSFLTPEGTGTDISGMLCGLSTSSGAYTVAGIVAESAVSAVTLFDATFGQTWFGAFVCGAVDADHLAIAAYIEGAANQHAYGVNTQESAVLLSTDTTNIAYQLKQLGYNKTWTQYSSSSLYAVCSMMARLMTTNFQGNNTVIDLMYKQEPGIAPENLNDTQISALEGFNCNVFVSYDNNTQIIEPGVAASGQYIDTVYGTMALAIDIQTNLYNLRYTSPTKIPQTDAGVHVLKTGAEQTCEQYVQNGLLGPGTWTNAGFGSLIQGGYLKKGYYVYVAPISTQPQASRSARQSPPIQIAAKMAGAIETVDVLINVNN